MYRYYEDDAEEIAEIERLKNAFFAIKGNYQVEALSTLYKECEGFLIHNESEEIEDLLNIVVAVKSFFQTKEKDNAREVTKEVWKKLSTKYEMSLYDIRILNPILFVAETPEEMFEVTQKCLEQLNRYRYNDLYVQLRMSMLFNLIHSFMDYKFSLKDKQFMTENNLNYVDVINEASDEISELNAKNELKYNIIVAFSVVYKAIANEDKISFYSSIAFLKSLEVYEMVDDVIQFYLNKYNINFKGS